MNITIADCYVQGGVIKDSWSVSFRGLGRHVPWLMNHNFKRREVLSRELSPITAIFSGIAGSVISDGVSYFIIKGVKNIPKL